MHFYDRLILLCKEKNIRITPLLTELNLSKGNLANWKKGTVPNSDVVLKIAQYFNISVDYLLGKTDTPTPEQQDEFSQLLQDCSPDEREQIKNYIEFVKSQRGK